MIIYRNIQSLIFSVIIFFSLIQIIYSQESLKSYDVNVRIWTEKTHYFTQEPVWAFIRVQNKGLEGPRLSRSVLDQNFVVKDSKGKIYRPGMLVSVYGVSPMKPDSVFERKFDISAMYAHRDYKSSGSTLYNCLLPERYKIYFKWQPAKYIEPVVSNEIEITIQNPTGDELNALHLLSAGIQKDEKDEVPDEYFDDLIRRYPNSVYADLALYIKLLHRMYSNGIIDLTQNMRTGKELLAKYPDSKYRGRAFGAIRRYYKKNNDLNGFTNYLQELNMRTKSALIKETTDRILKEIDKTKTWDDVVTEPSDEAKKVNELLPPGPPKRKKGKESH